MPALLQGMLSNSLVNQGINNSLIPNGLNNSMVRQGVNNTMLSQGLDNSLVGAGLNKPYTMLSSIGQSQATGANKSNFLKALSDPEFIKKLKEIQNTLSGEL